MEHGIDVSRIGNGKWKMENGKRKLKMGNL